MTTNTRRRQVRLAVKELVESVYSGTVNVARRIDGNDDQVLIYLADGQVNNDAFDARSDSAVLVIEFFTQDVVSADETLDDMAEPVEVAMSSDVQLSGLISGSFLTGWRYNSEEDASRTSLSLIYQIQFC